MKSRSEIPNRREFFRRMSLGVSRWIPGLGLLGFQVHRYANPVATGWYGWITWCGRLVGFLRPDRTIRWWP